MPLEEQEFPIEERVTKLENWQRKVALKIEKCKHCGAGRMRTGAGSGSQYDCESYPAHQSEKCKALAERDARWQAATGMSLEQAESNVNKWKEIVLTEAKAMNKEEKEKLEGHIKTATTLERRIRDVTRALDIILFMVPGQQPTGIFLTVAQDIRAPSGVCYTIDKCLERGHLTELIEDSTLTSEIMGTLVEALKIRLKEAEEAYAKL